MEDSKIESELVLPPSMTDRFDDLESTPSGSPQSNSVAGAAVDVEELKERKAEQNRRKQRAFRERREKYIRSLETTVDNYKGLQSAYKNLELRLLDADQRMEALRGENAELLKERERMTQSEFTTFKECVDMFRHENTQLRNTSLDLRMLLDVFRRGGPTDSVGRGMEEAQPTSQPIRFQPLELAAAYSGHPVSHAPTPLPIHLPQIGNYASSNHPFYPVSNLRHPHHPQHSYIDQQVVPGPRKASYTSQLNHYSPYPQHQPTHFKSENLCNLRSP